MTSEIDDFEARYAAFKREERQRELDAMREEVARLPEGEYKQQRLAALANFEAGVVIDVYVRKGAHRNQRTLTWDMTPFAEEFPDFFDGPEMVHAGIFGDGRDGVMVITGQPVDPNNPDGSPWQFPVRSCGMNPGGVYPSMAEALHYAKAELQSTLRSFFGVGVRWV